jgi:hypothetical protein
MRVAGRAMKAKGMPSKTLRRQREPNDHPPDPIPRKTPKINRAVVRRASHPVFGETASLALPSELAAQMIERRKSRSSDFGVTLRPRLSIPVRIVAFVGPSSSVTAAQPSGIYTRFPILL